MKKAEETPAPDQYKQDDKATKLRRFKDVHLGTDKKGIMKDQKLTPGPGHYHRVDNQYSRTFHHATRQQASSTAFSPVISGTGQAPDLQSITNFMKAAEQTDSTNREVNEIGEAGKRNYFF